MQIMAEFILYSSERDFEPGRITKILGIAPTKTHRMGENIVLTVAEKPHVIPARYRDTGWMYSTGYIEADRLSAAAEEILNIFGGRVEEIRRACSEYSLRCEIMFAVCKSGGEHYPGMLLGSEFVRFAGDIGAGLNFDILD